MSRRQVLAGAGGTGLLAATASPAKAAARTRRARADADAVEAVESFQPLFHLLNGDLCYANLNPARQPEVWRDFGNNNQTSAANRPWMPCPGNHEVEFYNGPQGFTSYLTRYTLPDNRVPGFGGRWYSFRIGSVLFVSLDADDVIFQDAAAFVAGPAALTPPTAVLSRGVVPPGPPNGRPRCSPGPTAPPSRPRRTSTRARQPTRWRTPSGRPAVTPPPGTGSRSST